MSTGTTRTYMIHGLCFRYNVCAVSIARCLCASLPNAQTVFWLNSFRFHITHKISNKNSGKAKKTQQKNESDRTRSCRCDASRSVNVGQGSRPYCVAELIVGAYFCLHTFHRGIHSFESSPSLFYYLPYDTTFTEELRSGGKIFTRKCYVVILFSAVKSDVGMLGVFFIHRNECVNRCKVNEKKGQCD